MMKAYQKLYHSTKSFLCKVEVDDQESSFDLKLHRFRFFTLMLMMFGLLFFAFLVKSFIPKIYIITYLYSQSY
ncbi:MAG: hypothetical protein AAFO69_17315, partial [Bacteroidota bacterium]